MNTSSRFFTSDFQKMLDRINAYTPFQTALALSLYGYNVSPYDRACKQMEILTVPYNMHSDDTYKDDFFSEIMSLFSLKPAYIMTELPYEEAVIYLYHALVTYGEEAVDREKSHALLQR